MTAIFTSTSTIPGEPGYPERSGQHVDVVRPITLSAKPRAEMAPEEIDMEVGPMFRVRFADGTEADAYADELLPTPVHPQQAEFDAYMAETSITEGDTP